LINAELEAGYGGCDGGSSRLFGSESGVGK
jgi:hypothetical protein